MFSQYDNVVDFVRSLSASDWITASAYIFAGIGWLIVFIYRALLHRSESKRRALEQRVNKVDTEVISWALRCIDVLSNAHILMATRGSGRNSSEIIQTRDTSQAALSALVDAGRLYFLNRNPDLVGLDRPYANRGFRPAILDALMIAHEELRRHPLNPDVDTARAARNIFSARRTFLSELREELDGLRDPDELRRLLRADDDWSEITLLVDDFEARYGAGTFWSERPVPRHVLLARGATT